MRAAVLDSYGPPSVLRIIDVPDPFPGPGQLLVRVRASSLNPLDTMLRSGALGRRRPLRFPAVLGFDFAGTVERVGADVEGWSIGERVYGRTDAKSGGTHAELAAVSAGVVDRIPATLSFDEAASLPLVAMTAVQALSQVDLSENERLLVNGAAGGVGSAAVQIGRAMGAAVSGVCSTPAAPLVASLGAAVLDYTKGELVSTKDRFDVVLDTVFSGPTPEILRVMTPRARYVTTGFNLALLLRGTLGRVVSRRHFGFVVSRADGGLLRRVSGLVSAGQLRPTVSQVVPFERIAEAHAALESGHVHGKIVVVIP